MNGPMVPPPIGEGKRELKLHNRMWMLFVFEGRSAKDTAKALQAEFRRCQETAGSVLSYADRQAWDKAARNGITLSHFAPAPPPPVRLGKPPMAAEPLLPAPSAAPRPGRPVSVGDPTTPRVSLVPPPPPSKGKPEFEGFSEADEKPDYTQRVRPERLHFTQCKWPIGDPSKDSFRHCGARKIPGLPYCAKCSERAYPPGSLNRQRAKAYAAQNRTTD